MIFKKTLIEGVWIIESEPIKDGRGYFTRIFAVEELKKHKINFNIVQMSHSFNRKKGTLRGLHFQKKPYAEDKIVQCIRGKIFDVAVDIRKNSKTFGKWVSVELSEKNFRMLLVPKHIAHGFQTLVDNCLIQYTMSEFFSAEHSSGYRWDDPAFSIKWPLKKPLLSLKDKSWPLLK